MSKGGAAVQSKRRFRQDLAFARRVKGGQPALWAEGGQSGASPLAQTCCTWPLQAIALALLAWAIAALPWLLGLAGQESPTMYGRRLHLNDEVYEERAAVAINQMQVAKDVLQYLQELSIFQAPEEELENRFNVARCVDHPNDPEHVYYEGYYHSLPSSRPFYCMNARWGEDEYRPAAPVRLRAFYESLRRLNQAWISALSEELQAWPLNGSTLGRAVSTYLNSTRLFGDLAIQYHAGAPIAGHSVAWHHDLSNSILHFSLGLHGRRTLHTWLFENSKDEHEKGQDKQFLLGPGDVYLSCPSLFVHGLEYYAAPDWASDRVIAVQARFIATVAEINYFRDADFSHPSSDLEESEARRVLFARVADAIARRPWTLPSLAQVKAVEAELQVLQAQEEREDAQEQVDAHSGQQAAQHDRARGEKEKQEKEKQEKEQQENARQEKERQEKERQEKERQEKERQEKERQEKERQEKERREKERQEKEKQDQEKQDQEKKEKKKQEKERQEKERQEKERQEKERQEKERQEKERQEKEKQEKEKQEKEKQEKERQEKARQEKEKRDKERQEKERQDKERQDKEKQEKGRQEKERQEKERQEKERQEKEKQEKERQEKARQEKEKQEKERQEKERQEKERQEKERQEKERQEKERQEKDRQEKDRQEKERQEKENQEKERQEKERREKERQEKERQEKERQERERQERERQEKEKREKEKQEKEKVAAQEERERSGARASERERKQGIEISDHKSATHAQTAPPGPDKAQGGWAGAVDKPTSARQLVGSLSSLTELPVPSWLEGKTFSSLVRPAVYASFLAVLTRLL